MIKRFCDRCGAETDITNPRIKVGKTKTEFWLEKFAGDTAFHTNADLCEKCVKSLRNWFISNK